MVHSFVFHEKYFSTPRSWKYFPFFLKHFVIWPFAFKFVFFLNIMYDEMKSKIIFKFHFYIIYIIKQIIWHHWLNRWYLPPLYNVFFVIIQVTICVIIVLGSLLCIIYLFFSFCTNSLIPPCLNKSSFMANLIIDKLSLICSSKLPCTSIYLSEKAFHCLHIHTHMHTYMCTF